MKKFLSVIIGSLILVAGLWHYAAASGGGDKTDVIQLFESKCSLCHSIERPKSKKKSKEEWQKTVMRMKNTNGCPITDEQAEMIIDYLVEAYGQ